MNNIQQQLDIKLAKLPIYINGKLDPTLLTNYVKESCGTVDNKNIFYKGSRNTSHSGKLIRVNVEDLVINRLQLLDANAYENESLLQLNHENIECILYTGCNIDFFIWITPLFVTKLKTVWVNIEQFRVYDVRKMFSDLLNGLEYMKARNVASGVIHEDNLAYNGQSWYISGIVNATKDGECASGAYTPSSLKSPRYISLKNDKDLPYIPEDDLWQLVLMYVITYYGFNPFQLSADRFKNTTLLNCQSLLRRIADEECQEITLTTRADCFGQILKTLLLSKFLNCTSYDLFRYIIENNGTTNTQGLNVLVDQESRASIEKAQEQKDIVSVNIDQYIEKFKECECIICFSYTIKYKFLNCNHEICCDSCYQRLENKRCPMCREPIVKCEKLSTEYINLLNEQRKKIYFQIASF
jgi:hypothetical protein